MKELSPFHFNLDLVCLLPVNHGCSRTNEILGLANIGDLMRFLFLFLLFVMPQVHAENLVFKTYHEADRHLNQVYQDYIKKLDGDMRIAFIKTHRAWIDYKELDCNFQTYGKEGKESVSALTECYKQHVESRINIIQYYNSCNANDGNCPLK